MTAFSRTDRSRLAEWWFTIDRPLLGAFLALFAVGVVVTLAASPAIAIKKGFHAFHFVERHLVFALLAVAAMLAVSLLEPRGVRRLSLVLFLGSLAAMAAILLWGEEINGARRWLRFGGFSLQPSELAKPALAVLSAWAFAEARDRPGTPALPIAVVIYLGTVALLVQQPDVGQTVLVTLIWGSLLVVSGQPLAWAAGLAMAAMIGLVVSYFTLGYVRLRVDRFLAPSPGDNSQVDRALQSFAEGGLFGRGPGEGTIKTVLPDAHTDFVFAVIAEEYGAIACLALLVLFAYVALRPILIVEARDDRFARLAVLGLCVLFLAQALINMGVNVGLLPAKGMTLPLISTGGSSMVAMGTAAGMILALTRRRPRLQPSSPLPVLPAAAIAHMERSQR